jgi:hypothetical protein
MKVCCAVFLGTAGHSVELRAACPKSEGQSAKYKHAVSKRQFFFVSLQPPLGQGLLVVEASRSHSMTHTVGRTALDSDKPFAESTLQHTTLTRDRS